MRIAHSLREQPLSNAAARPLAGHRIAITRLAYLTVLALGAFAAVTFGR